MTEIELKPGDLFFTQGRAWWSWLIRRMTVVFGHVSPVDHVGICVQGGTFKTAKFISALGVGVKRHSTPCQDKVAIYRSVNLTEENIDTIVARAESFVGKKYGFTTLLWFGLDWLLGCGGIWNPFIFRRLAIPTDWPVCSTSTAVWFSFRPTHKIFGVDDPAEVTPQTIWEFCQENPDKYTKIHSLESPKC